MPTDRRAAVVGSPVAHSLSPVLHLAAYRALGLTGWTYDRIEADEAALPGLVASLDSTWAGLSVTMPGKRAALELASNATPRALAVGAANTLVPRGLGQWHADCTDVDGVVGALRAAAGYTPGGGTGTVIGAGGTARAAIAGLAELGLSSVSVVARSAERATEALRCAEKLGLAVEFVPWSSLEAVAATAVVVNTAPSAAIEPHVAALAKAGYVLDVIYHPWPTPLARARDGHLATGLDMLLHQAFGQVEQFTSRPAPREAMRDALRAATDEILELPI